MGNEVENWLHITSSNKKDIKNIYGKYFSNIKISNLKPYWHFLCEKD